MPSFDARLRIVGQLGFPLGVVVDLIGQRMSLLVDGDELANWALDEIQIEQQPDGFHVVAEGEEIVLNVYDRARFASEIRRWFPPR